MARKPKDKSTESSVIGLLEIKLGACLTAPTRKMLDDLQLVAMECNRIRTGIARHWQRWREDNQWSPPQVISKKTGLPSVNKKGKPRLENRLLPQEHSTLLYGLGVKIAPKVGAKLVSGCLDQVVTNLTSDVPYNFVGNSSYKWEAILASEDSLPCWKTSLEIPCSNQTTFLAYDGECSSAVRATEGERQSMKADSRGAVVRFTLFSRESGCKPCYHVCRINARQLTEGHRRVLRKIATNEWKLSDSKLVFKEGKRKHKSHWSLQLTYRQPVRSLGLDTKRIATLTVGDAKAAHPFMIGGEGFRPWSLGRVRSLIEQYARLDRRRLAMRSEYRVAGSGVKGHGKRRFFRDLKLPSRAARNLMALFVEDCARDVLRFCERFNYGTVYYREPSIPWRSKWSWFAGKNLPFNWTEFKSKVGYKLKLHGVVLTEPPKETQKKAGVG